MHRDFVTAIEIDSEGKLHVSPATQTFAFVYREGLEVVWDENRRSLHSPVPREWSYVRWLEQILAAATAQGIFFAIDQHTHWINVPASVREDLLQAAAHAA